MPKIQKLTYNTTDIIEKRYIDKKAFRKINKYSEGRNCTFFGQIVT